MSKKTKKIAKWLVYYPVLFFICLELALLILGYRRYKDEPYTVQANPENAFIGNDSLGIYLNPGNYTITLNGAVQFDANHLENNRRFTPYQPNQNRPKIVFLGCSFTYGYGVNNEETFVAQLQEKLQDYSLENAGVVGYGTVQSLMQLPDILSDTSTQLVLLDFSSYHFMRNVLSQQFRRNLKIGYANSNEKNNRLMQTARFPYVTDCSNSIHFASWDELHEDWMGRDWFASINWIQTIVENYHDKKQDDLLCTECLIRQMANKCAEHNVKFGVVCLDQTEKTVLLHESLNDLPWLDVHFDFTDTNLTLLPYDSHPGAAGHSEIAHKIHPFILSLLANE